MRIGELAAMVGVSTRTVRHYHHLGLLPEPERRANGYREYRVRDAVVLARVRRLAEVGLSLDEIRDVLADDRGRELREVLLELDADLARQQEAIAARRERLAGLLAEADLDADSTVSPLVTEALRAVPAGDSAFAAFDRDMLTLLDNGGDPAELAEVAALFGPLAEPEAVARSRELYARLDEITGLRPGDPRVAALAADLADHIPPEMAEVMVRSLDSPGLGPAGAPQGSDWLEMMFGELPPAQREVFRLMIAKLRART
ncbi:MerR family transcriptional regulator [Actinomadura viridis]|uniref:MerR family transcriptional regulator n=1 Tax=Actinomadura viridis TaxID=58110 RepID=UPI0036A8D53E